MFNGHMGSFRVRLWAFLIIIQSILSSLANAEIESGEKPNWKVKGKIRVDSVQSSKTNDGTKAGSSIPTIKKSEIVLQRAQVEFVGNRTKSEMHIKLYLDKNYKDRNFLKNAFLAYNFSKSCALSIGKIDARDFAWEWDYSSTDHYLYGRSGYYGIDNVPGVEAKGVLENHSLFFQVLQGATPRDITDTHSTGGLTSTIQYRGQYFDNMIQSIATYAVVRTAASSFSQKNSDGSTTNFDYGNGYQKHFGVGLRLAAWNSTTDAEYDVERLIGQKNVLTASDEIITDVIIQTRLMPIAEITPYGKVIIGRDSKGATDNSGNLRRLLYGFGGEYQWNKNLRVHTVLTQETSTTSGTPTDTTTKETKLFMGVTGNI